MSLAIFSTLFIHLTRYDTSMDFSVGRASSVNITFFLLVDITTHGSILLLIRFGFPNGYRDTYLFTKTNDDLREFIYKVRYKLCIH